MNQDQIKKLLLSVEDCEFDFSVILSGKKSRKVNGLYKVDTREIILHNKNFSTDNLLVYTALHEYAHHIHSGRSGGSLPSRSHTQEFWAIFHQLLEKAEAKKLYTNAYAESPDLAALTELIREKYIKQNGSLFIELGKRLITARELCEKEGLRFEDYIDRVLCLPRLAAKTAMKSFSYNLDPALGQENMRFISAISNEEERGAAENALLSGKSPDSVKIALRATQAEEDPRLKLEKEKERIERTIGSLSKRLKEIEGELGSFT
jgi:hypothetical protein